MKLTIWALLLLSQVFGLPLRKCPETYLQNPAVTRFRRYIQIDTSKQRNLHKAVAYWRQQAVELGLPFHVFSPGGLPVCVITVLGSDPSLPSIMLNSHMDVVAANEDDWTYPPYSAYIDEKGDIYGRGSQDAKDVACQYMEAVRRLKENNVILKRNLHITIMPDEETGGFNGIKAFVKTEAFKAMNVGFVLDEGITSPDGTLIATFQDRRPWQMEVTVHGDGGHGSSMPENTAVDKARRFLNLVYEYRERLQDIMRTLDPRDFGSFASLNANILDSTEKTMNIIPTATKIAVDMRLAVDSNVTEMEQTVHSWVEQVGPGTELKFIRKDDVSEKTVLDNSSPYWVAMKEAVREMDIEIQPLVCPGTTDSMVLRNLGIPALGFSTKRFTIPRAHASNEYLNVEVFLKGIDIVYTILEKIGHLPTPCSKQYPCS